MKFKVVTCPDHETTMPRHCSNSQCRWVICNVDGCKRIYDPESDHWKGDDEPAWEGRSYG